MKNLGLSRRSGFVAGAFLLVVTAVGYALRPQVIDVDTSSVVRGPMRVTIDEEGRTRVRSRFVIAAPVAGRLERIKLREGDRISSGQTVALIAPLPLDSSSRRIAIARLEASLAAVTTAASAVQRVRVASDLAANTERRQKKVLEAGGIAPQQYEEAAADARAKREELAGAASRLQSAKAEVDAARAALAPTEGHGVRSVPVRSPVSGRVLRIPEVSERVVAASAPILELGDADALEVIADVLSSDAVRINPGNPVEIADWGGDEPLRGRVRLIEPSAFTRTSALGVEEQRVNVLVDILDSPSSLGDGFRVEMKANVWESQSVLTIPASAVFQRSSGWEVFTVEDGRARRRDVTMGHRNSAMVEVLSGLRAGEKVILFPSDLIDDGVRVK